MKPIKFLRSSLAKAITPWHYVSATALVALTVLGSQPAQAVMLDLGSLPGNTDTVNAQAISGDGKVVIGNILGATGFEIYRWSAGQGLSSLGTFAGNPANQIWQRYRGATSVNGDGSYIAGSARLDTLSTDIHAFRWSSASGFTDLGTLGGSTSYANGISDNGEIVVGESINAAGVNRAFRWQSGVMEDLGSLVSGGGSYANDVSGDGKVVVGRSDSTALVFGTAFRWDAANGMVDLGGLGGDGSIARAVSHDGAVVVGSSYMDSINNRAFRWTEAGGMENLGTLGGDSYAYDVNADGNVVVGYAMSNDGVRAFRWTQTTGMVNLGALTNQSSSHATGVSNDGNTVVGQSGSRAFIWNVAGPAMQDLSYLQTSLLRSAVTVSHLTASQNRRLRDLAQEQCQPGAAQTYCLSLGSQNYRGDADSSATQKYLNLAAGMRLNEQYSAGVTGSLGRADLNVQSAEQKKAFALGVWGAFQQNADDTGWGGAASVAVGQSENSFDRGMALTDVQRARAHLDLTGTAMRVAGNFGMRMNTPLGDSLITPEVALSHVSTQQDGFTERSVAFPLTVKGSTEQRTYATFGVRSATQVSPKGTLNLALAVDTLLSDNTQGIEGHSKVPGLSRFNLDSSVDQRRVIPTATVGYSHALTANSALGGGVQVATSTHQDGAPLFGLGMQYRYSF